MESFCLKNVYWKYNKDKTNLLKNLNFAVKQGDFHAFVGENGAGKSTTIRLIVGLSPNYEGELLINGLNAKEHIEARSGISYIPDKAVFPSNLSTFNYLYYTICLVRSDNTTVKEQITFYLNKYGISEIAKRNPNKLSAGQKKKVLLIRSILEKSKIIILDEPAANLDPTTRIQFFEELKKLNHDGVTIFISTHILEEIKKYANAATFIKKGEVIWSGPVKNNEIVNKYNNIFMQSTEGF